MIEKVLLVYNSILFIILIKIVFSKLNYDFYLNKSQRIIKMYFGFLINIVGFIGSGKTTTSSGIIHLLERELEDKIDTLIEDTKMMFLDIDFNDLDDFIIDSFLVEKKNLQDIYLLIEETDFKIYNNFVNNIELNYQLKKYVEALYYKYIDTTRVVSVDSFYSHNTTNLSYDLEDDLLKLTLSYKNQSFKMKKYKIYVIDENSLKRGNVMSSDKSTKTDGIIDHFKLFRNMYEGTNYLIRIQQDVEDTVAGERRLFENNFKIMYRKEIIPFKFILRTYEKITDFNLFLKKMRYRYIFKKKKRRAKIEKNFNRYHSTLRKISAKQKIVGDFFKSCGLIKVTGRMYFSSKDVGKEKEEYYETLEIYFPMDECYGVIDTYSYRYLRNYLEKISSHKELKKSYDFEKKMKELLEALKER